MATILKNARIFDGDGPVDIEFTGAAISRIGQNLPEEGKTVLQANGNLVVGGFADMHTHLDKAYTAGLVKNESGTLTEAIAHFNALSPTFTDEDYYSRGKRMLDNALAHGTLFLRTHATVSEEIGLRGIRVAMQLRDEYKDRLVLQVAAFPSGPSDTMGKEVIALARQALEEGADLLGGTPNRWPDQKIAIDGFFNLAKEFNVDIDLHTDEQDKPCCLGLSYIADKTAEMGMQGRVSAGHCCSLSSVPRKEADEIIRRVRDSGVSIVSLPSCNLYLMGREDEGIVRRGTTRIRELLEGGVNTAIGSDNIRDVFRPFGNADLLEELLLAAQVTRMDQPANFDTLLRMGTQNPARAMNVKDYGIKEGGVANLVVLLGETAQDAILDQKGTAHVIARGKVLA